MNIIQQISKELVADILQSATVKSYQHAIDSTKQEVSRQTVHNRLVAPDDLVTPVKRMEETPETLDIFADEDHVHLTPKGGQGDRSSGDDYQWNGCE